MLIERIFNEVTGSGDVAHDSSHLTDRGDSTPVIKLDKRLFEMKAERILPKHKLLKLLEPGSVKVLLNHSLLLKVRDGQMLYKEGDYALQRVYIVIVGKLALKGFLGHQDTLGVVGYVEGGDSLGEEGIFEVSTATRRDTAIAEGDTYVFEILRDNFDRMKDVMAR